MRNVITQTAIAGVLVVLGLAVGRFGAPAESQTAGGEAAAPRTAPILSDQALANLGARVEPIEAIDFVETVRVQATVEDAPLNTRPVASAMGVWGMVFLTTALVAASVLLGKKLGSVFRI